MSKFAIHHLKFMELYLLPRDKFSHMVSCIHDLPQLVREFGPMEHYVPHICSNSDEFKTVRRLILPKLIQIIATTVGSYEEILGGNLLLLFYLTHF